MSNKHSKVNLKCLEFLESVLTNSELGVVLKMIKIADSKTNSLMPLSDKTTLKELSKQFSIGKNRVASVFEKLHNIGVYVQNENSQTHLKKYWILSPYICFNGEILNTKLLYSFQNTELEKACKNI